MGLFNGIFYKMGSWHSKQLVQDSVSRILDQLEVLRCEKNGDASLEDALDCIIEDDFYIVNAKGSKGVETKFKELVSFYVVRNSRRDLDILSGEMDVLDQEIDRSWAALKDSRYI